MDEEMVNVNSFPCTEQRLIKERIQRKSASVWSTAAHLSDWSPIDLISRSYAICSLDGPSTEQSDNFVVLVRSPSFASRYRRTVIGVLADWLLRAARGDHLASQKRNTIQASNTRTQLP